MAATFIDGIMVTIWITLAFIIGATANGEIVIRNDGYTEYCDAEEFQAKCRHNEVIFMQNALYGRMRTGRCVDTNYGYVGCGKNVLHLADWMCSGRPTCRIPVPNSAFKKETDCPKDLKPYFEASYECIPVEMAKEQHCQNSNFVLPSTTSGFLSNHVTMTTRKGSEDCPWMIQGRYGQRINFTIFDFARQDLRDPMPSSGVGICRVYAVVREKGETRGHTICSGTGRISHAYTSTSHAVEVRILGKKDNDNPEYFLFKYEIIGCVDPEVPEDANLEREGDAVLIYCLSTSQRWRLVCDGNTWSGSYGNCSRVNRSVVLSCVGLRCVVLRCLMLCCLVLVSCCCSSTCSL